MNTLLNEGLHAHGLLQPARWRERVTLGLRLAMRVEHLLEAPEVLALLAQARAWAARPGSEAELAALAERGAALARSHPGSRSIDGTAHAAVSATHALARALQGRVLEAADYAAYAAVYAYACGAVNDPEAFEAEHAWQVQALHTAVAAGQA